MPPESAYKVTLLPGDGVGPRLVAAAVEAIAATGVRIEWERVEIGATVFEREGVALPERAVESVRRTGVALKGPCATSADPAYGSPNVALRRALDLHTTIRPARDFKRSAANGGPRVDMAVVKMNHEDLYARLGCAAGSEAAESIAELMRAGGGAIGPETAFSIKPLSVPEVRRVARAACDFAIAAGRSRVTIVHKATLIPHTDGLFLETAREVGRAYPGLEVDDSLVDTVCERMIARPDSFDVLLTARMYGDIVSGVAAAAVGGVGLAPGVNIGDGCAVFEAAHGSAPRLAGTDRANPMALILSGAMLLRHLGERRAADRLEAAVERVVGEGRTLTYDLAEPGRAASTTEVTEAVIEQL